LHPVKTRRIGDRYLDSLHPIASGSAAGALRGRDQTDTDRRTGESKGGDDGGSAHQGHGILLQGRGARDDVDEHFLRGRLIGNAAPHHWRLAGQPLDATLQR
jgi:hypothetical protein